MAKSGTIAGQLHILNNPIEQAVDSHMYPQYRQLVAKNGTMADQLHILKNAIEQAVDSHTYHFQ